MEKTAEEVIRTISERDITSHELQLILTLAKEVFKLKQELNNIKGTSHGGH